MMSHEDQILFVLAEAQAVHVTPEEILVRTGLDRAAIIEALEALISLAKISGGFDFKGERSYRIRERATLPATVPEAA